jgi:hypothetical protein
LQKEIAKKQGYDWGKGNCEKTDKDMKKIMFSEVCNMQNLVLREVKMMTRRLGVEKRPPRYRKGETVAIAMTYKELGMKDKKHKAGYKNKMFVSPELMPYRIKITGVKTERLQDISVEDCYLEGVPRNAADPIKYFSELIDKINGKGTWERNPWVYAYSFYLLKKE